MEVQLCFRLAFMTRKKKYISIFSKRLKQKLVSTKSHLSPCLIESKFQKMAKRMFNQLERAFFFLVYGGENIGEDGCLGAARKVTVISNDGMGILTYRSLERSLKDNDFHTKIFGPVVIIKGDTKSVRNL